jgi:hypothetical protein
VHNSGWFGSRKSRKRRAVYLKCIYVKVIDKPAAAGAVKNNIKILF